MKKWIKAARDKPGHCIRRTGATTRLQARLAKALSKPATAPSSSPPPVATATPSVRTCSDGVRRDLRVPARYQETGRNCHVNALAIGGQLLGRPMTPALLDFLKAKGEANPDTSHLVHFFNTYGRGVPYRLSKGKWKKGDTYDRFLARQTTGVYILTHGDHVITWDATTQLIHDTDPKNPRPLPVGTTGTANALNLKAGQYRSLYRVELPKRYNPTTWETKQPKWSIKWAAVITSLRSRK